MKKETLITVHTYMQTKGLRAAAFFLNEKIEVLGPLLEKKDEVGFAFAHYLAILGYAFPENHPVLGLESKHSVTVYQICELRRSYETCVNEVRRLMKQVTNYIENADVDLDLPEIEVWESTSNTDLDIMEILIGKVN